MSTLTANPVSGANSPCDGSSVTDSLVSWANARAGTGTQTSSATDSTNVVQGEFIGGVQWTARHLFFNFDTSALTSSAVISSAVFSVYTTNSGFNNEATNPANGALVGATPAATNNVVNGDFAQVGTTRYADTDILCSAAYNTTGYKDWTMNATGIAAISKTGITSLGIRSSNDFSDATAPSARSNWAFNDADAGSNPPKLVITYTIGTKSAILTFF